ncbi:hypothetical protein Btru_062095 [Bulinus truncatus]|nr:hypothetical protein Btru_062095 [Bulinus truncatus]
MEVEKYTMEGDHLGTEWLDYNDRPFEPILDKCALVSRGSIVIMIRKTFLLKYLRKNWKKETTMSKFTLKHLFYCTFFE